MRMLSLALLFLLGHALSLPAQPEKQPVPRDTNVRIGQLPNGLKYYIRQNNKPEDRAELRLVVHAGSLQEKEEQRGLAHFVEHMAFNGTRHFEKNSLISYLERTGSRFGADLNAYTSFEETVYKIHARTDSLPLLEKGLLILEDWASGITFDSSEIDKERGVVIAEWRTRLSPDQRLQQQYFPILYKDSRYAERLPIGEPEIIRTAPYSVIRDYYEHWYRPNLMAIVAVGDFDPDWMEQEVIRRFASLSKPENSPEHKTYPIPDHEATLFAIHTDAEAPFTQVRIVYKHPSQVVETIADYRQQLARSLYNRMLNARLLEVQMQSEPPFTFAFSGYGSDVGMLDTYTAYAFVREGGAIAGIEAVLKETRRAALHGFTPSELERQKAELMEEAEQAFLERDKVRSSALASRYAYHFLKKNPIPGPGQRLELYRELLPQIGLPDINPLPEQWITEENRVVIVTGPEKESAPLPMESELRELLKRIDTLSLSPYVDQFNEGPLVSDTLEAQPLLDSVFLSSLGVTMMQLKNGLRVYLKPTDFKNDEILMSAFSPGGHSVYSDELYPSASSAAAIIDQSGVGGFTMAELQKKLAGKKASASPYITELFEGVSGTCSPKSLEDMLKLVYLYFTAPRRDSTAFSSYISRQRSIFENILDNPYYYYADVKNKVKYQGHPRRQLPTLESLNRISLDEILDSYQDRFADASDFTFIFVGNFELAALQPLLSKYLGNLPSLNRQEKWRDVGAHLASGKIDTVIVRGQAPKALVEMTFHGGFDYESQERYHFYSMVSALQIRLRESMREEKGGVYGVRVNGNALPYPNPRFRITLSFNSEPTRTQELILAAREEISRLQEEGPDDELVAKVTAMQRQRHIKGLKENSYWLSQLSTRLQNDIPLEGILMEKYEPYLEGLSAEDIRDAAKKYLSGDNDIQLTLLPEKE